MDSGIPPEVQPILRLRAEIAAVLRTSAQLRNHNFPFTTLDDYNAHRRSRTQRPQARDRRVAQSLVADLHLAMEELLRAVECMPSRSVERYGTSIDVSRRHIDAHSLPPLGDDVTDWMDDTLHPIKTIAEDLWQPIDPVRSNPVETRWMIRRDLPEVAEIDAFSSSQPWDEETFRRVLRLRYQIGLVASVQDQIVASLSICCHRGHRCMLRFGMHPDFRGDLAAIALLNCERRELAPERQTRIIMDVRESDRYLCELLQTRHFRSHILRGAFGEEDGVRFTQSLLPPAQLIVDHAEQFVA